MSNPKVSIIIPHWNGIEVLSECLESLVQTKYSNIECNGIQITIQKNNVFKPLEFAVRL